MGDMQEEVVADAPTSSESTRVQMTAEWLRKRCLAHDGYGTPELNTRLYLHHVGFTELGPALQAYTECTVLYLDHNALSDLAALVALRQLHTLVVSHNMLRSCTALPCLAALRQIDVSYNGLCDLNGLAVAAPQLETLLAAHNVLHSLAAIEALSQLTTLDVAHNRLVDEAAVLEPVLALSASLRTCNFAGNAFVRQMKGYRKRCIAALPALRCLDDRPVSPEERAVAEAFVDGGAAAEAATRAAIAQRAEETRREQWHYFDAVARTAPRARRLAHGPTTAPSPHFLAQPDLDDDNVYIPSM